MEREGSGVVYCIAILTDQEQEGQKSAEYIRNYCTEKHVFPLIEIYQKQEQFFAQTLKTVPTVVFLALPGVSGLNAAEHLRSLYPKCGIIWCSDLDFSLHAFRLRIEYFFMKDAIIAVCGQKTPGGPVTYTVSPQPRLDR